jgi:ABC-type antimicrobial peptide transport system permease subunit
MFVAIDGDPTFVVPRLRSAVQTAAQSAVPALPAVGIAWMRDVLEPQMKPWRLAATMFSLFGAAALIMATVGLYGVVSFTATLRASEIAIRIALGANRRQVLSAVAGEGLRTVLIGLAVGAALAIVGAHWIGPLLFQTSPGDPITIAGVSALLLIAAAAATAMPTLRVLRADLSATLRAD